MEIQKTGFTLIGVSLIILLGVILKFYPNYNWVFYVIVFLIIAIIIATIIVIQKYNKKK
ncbi:hypothetical protein BC962_2155 [Gillisia mitskevichiae]|uniref:Uncharacterized protein n=1 Tax=Gillisia mitskevichiae TaxID=270921 RepID=A0A495PVS7_9FLAO|nr:hypothetical protein [Gillisia mitskevichiae]RKS53890.1 hypothetical protein BC962_2155 [Gillisia mitskevichiae]